MVELEANYSRESLSARSIIKTEQYSSPNGMAGVVAHWGVRRTRDAMDREVADAIENGLNASHMRDSGFSEIYRMPRFQSSEEMEADIQEVARRLTTRTLEMRGWNPEEVDYLDFGSSVGVGGMAEQIADELGLVNARIASAYLACNSAGNLLHERLQDEESAGKKVVVLTVDPVTRLLRNYKTTDYGSIQLFSNGGAALGYEPGVDLSLITGVATERRDARGITAIEPYHNELGGWIGDESHVIFRNGDNRRVRMSPPPQDMEFFMKGRETAVVFIQMATEAIALTYAQYKNLYPNREPDFAVGHHPSLPVFRGVENRLLSNHGISLPFEWVVSDGNSSGATSLIAFNRSMANYKSGQHGIYASYGAGGTADCFAIEIGSGAPTSPRS